MQDAKRGEHSVVRPQRQACAASAFLLDAAAAEHVLRNTWGIAIDVSKRRDPATLGLEQRGDNERCE